MDNHTAEIWREHAPCTDLRSGKHSRIFRSGLNTASKMGPQNMRIVDTRVACQFGDNKTKPFCSYPNKGHTEVQRTIVDAQRNSFRSMESAIGRLQLRQEQRKNAMCQRLAEDMQGTHFFGGKT